MNTVHGRLKLSITGWPCLLARGKKGGVHGEGATSSVSVFSYSSHSEEFQSVSMKHVIMIFPYISKKEFNAFELLLASYSLLITAVCMGKHHAEIWIESCWNFWRWPPEMLPKTPLTLGQDICNNHKVQEKVRTQVEAWWTWLIAFFLQTKTMDWDHSFIKSLCMQWVVPVVFNYWNRSNLIKPLGTHLSKLFRFNWNNCIAIYFFCRYPLNSVACRTLRILRVVRNFLAAFLWPKALHLMGFPWKADQNCAGSI